MSSPSISRKPFLVSPPGLAAELSVAAALSVSSPSLFMACCAGGACCMAVAAVPAAITKINSLSSEEKQFYALHLLPVLAAAAACMLMGCADCMTECPQTRNYVLLAAGAYFMYVQKKASSLSVAEPVAEPTPAKAKKAATVAGG